jgi:hypothetical protein
MINMFSMNVYLDYNLCEDFACLEAQMKNPGSKFHVLGNEKVKYAISINKQ